MHPHLLYIAFKLSDKIYLWSSTSIISLYIKQGTHLFSTSTLLQILIYEYMENGNLHRHLFGKTTYLQLDLWMKGILSNSKYALIEPYRMIMNILKVILNI